MADDLTPELSDLVQQASREGDEETLFKLTQRINELLRQQHKQQPRLLLRSRLSEVRCRACTLDYLAQSCFPLYTPTQGMFPVV
jgi:hypothetical protein